MRFGQPSASLPSDPFPFNERGATDPVSGRSDGLLERLADPHGCHRHTRHRADCFLALLPLRRGAALRRDFAADRYQPAKRRARPAGTEFGRLQPAAARSIGADGLLDQPRRSAACEPLSTPGRRQRRRTGDGEGRRHHDPGSGVPSASAASRGSISAGRQQTGSPQRCRQGRARLIHISSRRSIRTATSLAVFGYPM